MDCELEKPPFSYSQEYYTVDMLTCQHYIGDMSKKTSYKAPSREGKKHLGVHVDPELHQAIKVLAVKEGRSVQSLMVEAMCDVLTKYDVSCPVEPDKE